METIVQLVVLEGQFAKLLIRLQQEVAKLVRIENFANRMLISADLDEHIAQLQNFVDMGFDEIYLHNVGRNQAEFISTFGERVLPNLKLA